MNVREKAVWCHQYRPLLAILVAMRILNSLDLRSVRSPVLVLHCELSGGVVCFSLPQSCLNGLAGVEELPIRFTNHLNNYSAIQISNHIGEFLKDLTYVRFTVH